MTRDGTGYRGGNRERARFCNARGAALMIRIHADGSTDPGRARDLDARPGAAARLDGRHLRREPRAGRLLQRELVAATGARDLGVVERADLTGFNWADVPAVLVETGLHVEPARGGAPPLARYQQRSRARSPARLSAS